MKLGRLKNENGISIVLGCVLIFVLVAVAAMAVGLGVVTSSKSRIQNVGNLVALGVLETVTRNAGNGGATARAQQIAQANALPGMKQLGTFREAPAAGTSGQIDYGNWFFADPDGAGGPLDPCGSDYPCYVSAGAYNPAINAVRVTVNNQINNKIFAPFTGALGYGGGQEQVTATAVLAGQCTVMLMDTSLSMTYQTHRYIQGDIPNSSFAVYPFGGPVNCAAPANSMEQSYCNMAPVRSGAIDPTVHYKDDYRQRSSLQGPVLVDTFVDDINTPSLYAGPEPMRTLFLGANASLRDLFEGSSGSLWRGLGFENGITQGIVSGQVIPINGFATNPGVLVQATNLDNRGTFQAGPGYNPIAQGRNPNFLDFGWYPRRWATGATEETNIIEAFDVAIASLQNQALSGACPTFFKKNIVIATDGVGNCVKTGSNTYTCSDTFAGYVNYRNQLLGMISQELQRKNISVTVLYAGSHVGPHFKNIVAPTSFIPGDGTKYFSLEEALANGYGGYNSPPGQKAFSERPIVDGGYPAWCASNCSSLPGGCNNTTCQNQYAYNNMGATDVEFREPLSVMAQLAMNTDGTICPLLPLDPISSHYIDHDNDSTTPKVLDEAFHTGPFQTTAITEEDPTQQAIRCIKDNWKNKFFLTEDDPA